MPMTSGGPPDYTGHLVVIRQLTCQGIPNTGLYFLADNHFEHGNYLSSNNQFLDGSDDAGFIFVSSEIKVKINNILYKINAVQVQCVCVRGGHRQR